MGTGAARSEDTTSERNVAGWREQNDGAIRIGHTEDQHLGAHRTNLPRREVEDGDDQLAVQILRPIMDRQLGAGASHAERPEIDAKLVGRFAGFRKGLGLEDPADPHVDSLEVRDVNGGRVAQHA